MSNKSITTIADTQFPEGFDPSDHDSTFSRSLFGTKTTTPKAASKRPFSEEPGAPEVPHKKVLPETVVPTTQQVSDNVLNPEALKLYPEPASTDEQGDGLLDVSEVAPAISPIKDKNPIPALEGPYDLQGSSFRDRRKDMVGYNEDTIKACLKQDNLFMVKCIRLASEALARAIEQDKLDPWRELDLAQFYRDLAYNWGAFLGPCEINADDIPDTLDHRLTPAVNFVVEWFSSHELGGTLHQAPSRGPYRDRHNSSFHNISASEVEMNATKMSDLLNESESPPLDIEGNTLTTSDDETETDIGEYPDLKRRKPTLTVKDLRGPKQSRTDDLRNKAHESRRSRADNQEIRRRQQEKGAEQEYKLGGDMETESAGKAPPKRQRSPSPEARDDATTSGEASTKKTTADLTEQTQTQNSPTEENQQQQSTSPKTAQPRQEPPKSDSPQQTNHSGSPPKEPKKKPNSKELHFTPFNERTAEQTIRLIEKTDPKTRNTMRRRGSSQNGSESISVSDAYTIAILRGPINTEEGVKQAHENTSMHGRSLTIVLENVGEISPKEQVRLAETFPQFRKFTQAPKPKNGKQKEALEIVIHDTKKNPRNSIPDTVQVNGRDVPTNVLIGTEGQCNKCLKPNHHIHSCRQQSYTCRQCGGSHPTKNCKERPTDGSSPKNLCPCHKNDVSKCPTIAHHKNKHANKLKKYNKQLVRTTVSGVIVPAKEYKNPTGHQNAAGPPQPLFPDQAPAPWAAPAHRRQPNQSRYAGNPPGIPPLVQPRPDYRPGPPPNTGRWMNEFPPPGIFNQGNPGNPQGRKHTKNAGAYNQPIWQNNMNPPFMNNQPPLLPHPPLPPQTPGLRPEMRQFIDAMRGLLEGFMLDGSNNTAFYPR